MDTLVLKGILCPPHCHLQVCCVPEAVGWAGQGPRGPTLQAGSPWGVQHAHRADLKDAITKGKAEWASRVGCVAAGDEGHCSAGSRPGLYPDVFLGGAREVAGRALICP